MTRDGADPQAWHVPSGWTLRYVPTTGSTNDDAKAAAHDGIPARTVFLADAQSHGRGRLDRVWVAPPGTSLLCSILLQRDLPPVDLTALCSVSIAESIAALTGLHARIKWPNDVMVHDRKACGILTEVVTSGGVPLTVVGIGLNVNFDPRSAGLPETATSLSGELGTSVSRQALFEAILSRIAQRLESDSSALLFEVRQRWEALLWRRRQQIVVSQDGAILHGVVEGLAPSGALLLRQDDGCRVEVTVGDVVVQ